MILEVNNLEIKLLTKKVILNSLQLENAKSMS